MGLTKVTAVVTARKRSFRRLCFTGVCQSFCSRGGGGGAWWWACMGGGGSRGACMAGRYAWQEVIHGMHGRGACMVGGMHGRGVCGRGQGGGHVWQGGQLHGRRACMAGFVCVCGGCAWQGGMHGRAHPPPADTTRYGQWAGGTHPTGMHSC